MEIRKEIYADAVGQINFTGGMVRFNYVTLQPADEGVATAETVCVVMPIQGFLGVVDSMEGMINKMLEEGVLVKQEPAAEQPAEEKAEKKPAKKSRKKAEK